MRRLTPRARRYISERVDEHLDEFESPVLHNQVALADDGDDVLIHLARGAADAYHAHTETYDADANEQPVHEAADDAHFRLLDALTDRMEENVAKECLHVIEHAGEWADRDADADVDVLVRRDREEYDAAKYEAREWLQLHTEAAKRASVFEKQKEKPDAGGVEVSQ